MSTDTIFFNTYLLNLKIEIGQKMVNLIKSNNFNSSLYKFNNQDDILLISYNDNIIKNTNSNYINLLNNTLYHLSFTNKFFIPTSFNEISEILDFQMENIKNLLSYKEIMNLQTKQIYKLTNEDVKYIEKTLSMSYDEMINQLFNNLIVSYNIISVFFGIKINYWYYDKTKSVEFKIIYNKLEVSDYLFNKMGIDSKNIKEFNIFNDIYLENDKINYTNYYLVLNINNNLKNYYLNCN